MVGAGWEASVELVERAKRGDRAALETLLARYDSRLRRIVRARLGGALRAHMETQDVLNSVAAEAIAHIERFDYRGEGSFLHWLGRLVAHKVAAKADHYGAQKRGGGIAPVGGDTVAERVARQPASSSDPADLAAQHEDHERVHTCLAELPGDQRELVLMAWFAEMTCREIGEHLQCSEDAARMRVKRAEVALAAAFESRHRGSR